MRAPFALLLIAMLACPLVQAQTVRVVPRDGDLPPVTAETPRIQPGATGTGSATIRQIPQVVYKFAFADWQEDHMHWPEPSSVTIYDTGEVRVEAAHLANMKRTGQVLDTGDWHQFFVYIMLLDRNKQIVWADWVQAASLGYKHETDNVNKLDKFYDLAEQLRKGYEIKVERQIVHRLGPRPQRYRNGKPI